ncbi:MAG: hypothetical protein ABGX20_09655 [Bacillus sp. (in: firmicutes)]|jgi:hypothetical protein
MDSMHRDFETYYKNLEAELNKRIHTSTNNLEFIRASGRALEAHLSWVKLHRRLTTRWLNRLGLVNKDELAAISLRVVEHEGKLDALDDQLYNVNKTQQENQRRLKDIHMSLKEWLTILRKEITELHCDNISSLEKELLALKLLFNEESEVEENENDRKKCE